MFILHKTINGNNKMRRGNKARFLLNTLKKTPSWGSPLLVLIQFFGSGVGVVAYLSLSGSGREVGWGGRVLTFPAFRMGAYSRWALIRGWALIRINTVYPLARSREYDRVNQSSGRISR